MRRVLRGGRVFDPSQKRDVVADVVVHEGVIEAITPHADAAGAQVLELGGAWVCPGFIDLHSVLRDAKDLESAGRGGFTAVVAAPESTLFKGHRVEVLRAAPLTRNLEGNELGEDRADAVCLSQGFKPIARTGVLRRALQYAGRQRLLVVHPEDPSLTGGGVIGEGLTATRLGLPAVPVAAETTVIARDLQVLEETGGRLHFAHLTTARGVELVRDAKARGLNVTADVTPHHLSRDTSAAENYSLDGRVWPPLRSPADVAALKAGLRDGVIDAIACDHVQVDVLDREHAFEACAPGCEAFEHAVPVALGCGLSDWRFVEVLALGPAKILGLPSGLEVGRAARLTVVDPKARAARGIVVGPHAHFAGGIS